MPYRDTDNSELAARISAAFSEQIGAARYQLWFPSNAIFAYTHGLLTVVCRNTHFRDWSREQFGDALIDAARRVVKTDVDVDYVIDATRFRDSEPDEAPPAPKLVREAPKAKREPSRRLRSMTEFVVGGANRVAAAAALATIEEPGLGPNPITFFGPAGTGKTHLLEAVTAGLKGERPLLLSAEEFTHRFVQSARTHKSSGFRRQTRGAGAFLIDDLQFLANKKATQEELVHVVDHYIHEGRPVAVALDTHPRLADDLLPELVDRLLGGAAWGLLPPDQATRVKILKQKAKLPDDVTEHLAERLTGNVREIEGAVHTLKHFAKVTGEAMTLAVAKDLLSEWVRDTKRALTLAEVDAATCKVFKLSPGTLQSKTRTLAVTQPRMFAVYLARKHTVATYGEIAKHFGVRQHSTAVAAEKKVRGWLAQKALFPQCSAADTLAKIERELMR